MSVKRNRIAELFYVVFFHILAVFVLSRPTMTSDFLINIIFALVPFILIAMGNGRHNIGKVFEQLGFTKSRMLKQVGIGLLFGVIFIVGILCLMHFIWALPIYTARSGQAVFIMVIFQLIIAISEEVLFRGYFILRLNEIFNRQWASIMISALYFAAGHYFNYHYLPQTMIAFLLAVYVSILRLKIKNCSMLSLIIIHLVYDLSAVFLFSI